MKLTEKKLKQLILEEYNKGDWLPPLYKKIQGLNAQIDKIQGAIDNIEKKIEAGYVLDDASPQVYNKTKAIFDSVSIDEKYYPENPVKTSINFKDKIVVEIESKQISHIRANLNATLRLIQASHDSINSVKI